MSTGVWRPRCPSLVEDLEASASGQHHVEDEEVEGLAVDLEKPILAGGCDDDVVVGGAANRGEDLRQFPLVPRRQAAAQHKNV